jgi:hypothetical protein
MASDGMAARVGHVELDHFESSVLNGFGVARVFP